MSRRLAVIAFALALAACGGILPKPQPAPALYRLTPATMAPAQQPVDAQLVVDMPVAPASLDTERIALTRGGLQFDYFANAAWTDRASVLVQSLMVETIEGAGVIRVVARASGELRPDAVLMTDLRDFEAVYSGDGPPDVQVRFDCRLVRTEDRSVLAVKTFAGSAHAAANDTGAIVAAFNDAAHAALAGLPAWAAQGLPQARR